MAARIRRNVWSLPAGDGTLDWYRRAVAALIPQPAALTNSWRYLAAIHGVPQGQTVPAGAGAFWDQCQHQSWFFLPWHRGYLASFESVVARQVADLGGPPDWAVPYWDYSESLASNPNARLLPPAFRDRLLPDGSANALWSRRAAAVNGDFGLGPSVVNLAALALQNFTNSQPGVPSGFGGPVTGFNPGGGDNGALESVPHNRIHTRLGGSNGFMAFPDTAALDPIFWLHHCNIDRLWEVWRNQGAGFANPSAPQWRSGVRFAMHDGSGAAFSFVAADMLDTTQVLHGYRYDTVPPATEPVVLGGIEMVAADSSRPEMAGASAAPVQLVGDMTRVDLVLQPKLAGKSFTESALPRPTRVFLNLENITGTGGPGDFTVFVDLPDDDQPPVFVGMMTTFGLERASNAESFHGGSGLSQIFEITDAAERLRLTDASTAKVQVSFVRETPIASDEAAPEGLLEFVRPMAEAAIKVGRVSLFYQ